MARRGSSKHDHEIELAKPVPWEAPGLLRWERMRAFIEWLPVTKGIRAGESMELIPLQVEFLQRVYGEDDEQRPYVMGVQSVARGNGKTGFIAGLVLGHMVGPECEDRGEIPCAAANEKQAGTLFNEVMAIVEAVPRFDSCVNIARHWHTMEVLHGPGKGTTFNTLSKNPDNAHSLAPSLFVYDELARAKDGELLDNLITGMGKRKESLGFVISTQAPNDQHPLSLLIDADDPNTFVQCISADDMEGVTRIDDDPECDVELTLENLRLVNPALGHYLDEKVLQIQLEKAKSSPAFENSFRNLRLNQRIAAEAGFVDVVTWRRNQGAPSEEAFERGQVWVGLDLSARNDFTAMVLAVQWGGYWHIRAEFWVPGNLKERTEQERMPLLQWHKQGLIHNTGKTVDYENVALRIGELCQQYDVAGVAYDRWRIDVLEREFDRHGVFVPMVPFGQGYRDMAPAVDTLEAELLNGRVKHGNHPALNMCAYNAVVTMDPANNRKFEKPKSRGKIDGIVALAMAMWAPEMEDETPPISGGATVV